MIAEVKKQTSTGGVTARVRRIVERGAQVIADGTRLLWDEEALRRYAREFPSTSSALPVSLGFNKRALGLVGAGLVATSAALAAEVVDVDQVQAAGPGVERVKIRAEDWQPPFEVREWWCCDKGCADGEAMEAFEFHFEDQFGISGQLAWKHQRGCLGHEKPPLPGELPDLCRDESLPPRYLAESSEKFPEKIVTVGNKAALESSTLDAGDFSRSEPFNPDKLQVVLVPVDDDASLPIEEAEALAKKLVKVYEGFDVQFSVVKRTLPVGVFTKERLLFFTDMEERDLVEEKIFELYPAHVELYLLDTDRYALGAYSNEAIVAARNEGVLFSAAHELGNIVTLKDGYLEHQYDPDYLVGNEKLTTTSDPSPVFRVGDTLFEPELVPTGWACNGEPIYSILRQGDFMDTGATEEKIMAVVKGGGSFFNPIQKAMIEENIKKRLKLGLWRRECWEMTK